MHNSLIEESIKIESNVSELYGLFYQIFEEDKDFWWQLKIEERKKKPDEPSKESIKLSNLLSGHPQALLMLSCPEKGVE